MRVIIIGAGPTGLVLAHALIKAGIDDFVLLERREQVVDESGAGLGLWPQGVRILDQLGNGMFEEAEQIVPKMKRSVRLGNEGDLVLSTDLFAHIEENHGHAFWLFERVRLLQLLYSHLPHASDRVLTGKSVESLSETETSVTVRCQDGSEYTGDILIGADGVHSITRTFLFHDTPDRRTELAKGLTASFRGIFACGPLVPGLVPGEMIERNKGAVSSQLLTTKDSVVWFFYQRMDNTTTKRSYYSDSDMEKLAEEFKDFSVVEDGSVRLGDLWKSRKRATMADLEEGIMEKWFRGRVVLVGDAVHKMLSNLALGGNTAIESVVSLVNKLHALDKSESPLSTKNLEAAFTAYQRERQPRAKYAIRMSGLLLRYSWLLARILTLIGKFSSLENDRMVADKIFAGIPRPGLVLDFAPESHPRAGKIPWDLKTVKPTEN
ncbi:hypothetical protein jhhlp_008825 [Lomentospora prolificans]|uniref:FAD-binding domain-containing protein n=1 Tax=Lomentospora prolificans TaxID=41688 RepID=A0A2N3MZ53_9PEZI|nr:hypothetical protein jhhlp_008825 [Lomentospora prolificans]